MEDEQVLEAHKSIHGYNLELIEPPCISVADKWTAKAYI